LQEPQSLVRPEADGAREGRAQGWAWLVLVLANVAAWIALVVVVVVLDVL
jgi:hypothetical protein